MRGMTYIRHRAAVVSAQLTYKGSYMCDETSHATKKRRGYVQYRCCQSPRVWQRHRTIRQW